MKILTTGCHRQLLEVKVEYGGGTFLAINPIKDEVQ
jgi:hypothetical protein